MSHESDRTISDVTCLACGCLCDDIVVRVEGGTVVEAGRACEIGRAWFTNRSASQVGPPATIEGQPATLHEAIALASEILTHARSPIVLGLTRASLEAQAESVAIADALGASIDPSHSSDVLPNLLAVQRVGRVSATLGEVRNRADVVIFWDVDPATTHPRHLERYSVEPRGRFVPGGRADRFMAVVHTGDNATARLADLDLRVEPDRQLAVLSALRGLVRGARLDLDQVARATCVHASQLKDLVERLRSARYGAFFFGDGLGRSAGGPATVEAALTLVRDLNTHAPGRFVALPIGRASNASGAEAVLTWQASAPIACDYARGHPRYLPGEADAASRLGRGKSDAALIVADDPVEHLAPEALAHLARIPTVVIAPDATSPERAATVGLAIATTGLDAGGTVTRCDGVSLPLRPVLPRVRPSDREVLHRLNLAIHDRLATEGNSR